MRFASLFARFRSRAAVLCVLSLAACAPSVAPLGSEADMPYFSAHAFITRDGLSLPLRQWDAAKPRAIIVALHGMSDYSEAFDMPGPWFAAHDITMLAYDQRGFGAAPDRGIWAGSTRMRQDLHDMVMAVHARYPGLPVFALGESMGGAVVLSALADHDPPPIAGAILAAPAVWAREDMPLSYRVVLFLAAHLVPWLKLSGQGLHIMPSDNIPMLIKLSRDPLFQHHARVDQIYGLVNLMDEARRAPEHLISPPPILYLYGAHDQIIPRKSAEDTIAALGRRATVVEFPHGYHMLLRDLDRKLVWRTILKWVDAHLSRNPAMSSTHISSRLRPRQTKITAKRGIMQADTQAMDKSAHNPAAVVEKPEGLGR